MRHLPLVVLLAGCGASSTPAPQPIANTPPAPAAAKPKAASDALLAWPVAPLSAAQRAEAKTCDLGKPPLAAATSACEHAAVAATCAGKDGDPTPACLDAYRAAVRANPAFAFATKLAGTYFGKVHLVAPPPAADRTLVGLVLAYKWSGLGDGVEWKLTVKDASTHPTFAVTGANGKPVKDSPAAAKAVGAFATSLDSFLPIKEPLQAIDCTDNYPDWSATLELDDGSRLELATNRSNLLGLGGPWQLTAGGVTYLQLSPGLTHAVADLVHELGLPIGQPAGMMCRGYDIGAELL